MLTKRWAYNLPRLRIGVVENQLLFTAPIWLPTVDAIARANLRRPQKVAVLRTIKAYKTVSEEATFFLAGMPSGVDLIVAEGQGEGQSRAANPSE
jgi:hypothetical protein